MFTLICYLRHDYWNHAFEVEIGKAKTVAALRDAIKEKMRPEFDGISADSLLLWKASVLINRDLKESAEALNLVNGDSLDFNKTLSDIFSSDLEKNHIHVIFDRPYSGELYLPMSIQWYIFFP